MARAPAPTAAELLVFMPAAAEFAPRSRSHLRAGSAALAWVLLTTVISSCGAHQRAAEKLVDPRLRSDGVLLERHGQALALGPYRVEGLAIEDEAFDGSGPLAADAAGRTRPTQQWRLRYELVGGPAPWQVECVGQRRQPPDHDLAAVADEPREEIAVRCQLGAGDQRWVLRLEGTLADNLLGELAPATSTVHASPGSNPASPASPGPARVVEVLLWHQPWSIARRRLPASLALLRTSAGGTEAALVLDEPERAWLAAELDEQQRALVIAALLALRALPLGFEG